VRAQVPRSSRARSQRAASRAAVIRTRTFADRHRRTCCSSAVWRVRGARGCDPAEGSEAEHRLGQNRNPRRSDSRSWQRSPKHFLGTPIPGVRRGRLIIPTSVRSTRYDHPASSHRAEVHALVLAPPLATTSRSDVHGRRDEGGRGAGAGTRYGASLVEHPETAPGR